MATDFDKLCNCFLVKHERTITLTGRTWPSVRTTDDMKHLANWSSTFRLDGLLYGSSAPKVQKSIVGMKLLQDHKISDVLFAIVDLQ